MAKCKAHGTEIGTVYFTTSAKRYMSDGVILKNIGFGWKIYGKVKAGLTPAVAFANQQARMVSFAQERPCAAAYKKALHDLCGVSKRWKLHAAVGLMPDDPDGVWSEVCDGYGDNVSADLDDLVELCRLYKNAEAEAREVKAAA